MDRQEIQGKIEGILFAVGESVAIKDIAEALQEDDMRHASFPASAASLIFIQQAAL